MLMHPDVFARRVRATQDGLRSIVAEQNVGNVALMVTCPRDLLWLTGMRTPGKPPIHCVLVSLASEAVIVVTRSLEMSNVTERAVTLGAILCRPYEEGDDAVGVLTAAADAFHTIYVESDTVSAFLLQTLRDRTTNTQFVPLHAPVVAGIRMTKEDAEIAVMRVAATAASAAVRAVCANAKVGMTECEVANIASNAICRFGGEASTYPPFVHSGARRGTLGHCAADRGTEILNRQLVMIEFGASANQYHGAKMHTLFTGSRDEIPESVLQAEHAVADALLCMTNAARIGATPATVAAAGWQSLESAVQIGWTVSSRMGYSIGIAQGAADWGEANVVSICIENDGRALRRGTTLHLIPYVSHPLHGAIAFSQCVVVVSEEGGAHDLADEAQRVKSRICCIESDRLRHDYWLGRRVTEQLRGNHRLLDPTPLRTCPKRISKLCAVSTITVKDESFRGSTFPNASFKMLGASYAVLRQVATVVGLSPETATWDSVRRRVTGNGYHNCVTVCTATDGNHGRAVAWAATALRQSAVVFMPRSSSQARIDAVKRAGGHVVATECTYDDTVRAAVEHCARTGAHLVQDTEAVEGGDEIDSAAAADALWACKAGYTVLCCEIVDVYKDALLPTHVFVQVGVGSLASVIVDVLGDAWGDRVRFVAVEAVEAACLLASFASGAPVTVSDRLPVFSEGLACHTLSSSAWLRLRRRCDAALACDARCVFEFMQRLRLEGACASGDSGAAVPLAALAYLSDNDRMDLGLSANSRVLCINTEGHSAATTVPPAHNDNDTPLHTQMQVNALRARM